jgi:hypothetical protein
MDEPQVFVLADRALNSVDDPNSNFAAIIDAAPLLDGLRSPHNSGDPAPMFAVFGALNGMQPTVDRIAASDRGCAGGHRPWVGTGSCQ